MRVLFLFQFPYECGVSMRVFFTLFTFLAFIVSIVNNVRYIVQL